MPRRWIAGRDEPDQKRNDGDDPDHCDEACERASTAVFPPSSELVLFAAVPGGLGEALIGGAFGS